MSFDVFKFTVVHRQNSVVYTKTGILCEGEKFPYADVATGSIGHANKLC